ncbi:hypothetical protein [Actinocorallia longicatena]
MAAEKRYRELVRLSYLILPGDGSREVRLALARRIVDRNLPRRPVSGRTYFEARQRVLRQSLHPSRRLRIRLVPWQRGLPAAVPGNPALAALEPGERVTYVLRRVAKLRRYIVRDLLVDLGVGDPQTLLTRVEEMPDLDVLAPVNVGKRRRFRRSRVPLLVATALTCALVAAVEVEEHSHSVAAARATHHPTPAPVRPTKAPLPVPPAETVYWKGTLPAKGGAAELRCRRETLPDGTVRQAGILIVRKVRFVASECADGATGLWWKAPSQRWYYLAAARPGLQVKLAGVKRKGALAYVKGTKAKKTPLRKPVLTTVAVKAGGTT